MLAGVSAIRLAPLLAFASLFIQTRKSYKQKIVRMRTIFYFAAQQTHYTAPVAPNNLFNTKLEMA